MLPGALIIWNLLVSKLNFAILLSVSFFEFKPNIYRHYSGFSLVDSVLETVFMLMGGGTIEPLSNKSIFKI